MFVILAVALAGLFVRLGVWQLDRLRERRAHNAELAAGLSQPPVPFGQLGRGEDTRRAVVAGLSDYEREFVVSGRSMNGSPGVYIITPVRIDSSQSVLVNRGWVYSPDAAAVDLSRWRESRTRFTGYTLATTAGHDARGLQTKGRAVRSLDSTSISRMVPYRTERLYLVARDSGDAATPARLPEIELTNGPHLSYAIQWFCFAAIALIGAGVVVARTRKTRDAPTAA